MAPRYRDRHAAGEALARALSSYAHRAPSDPPLVVLALPRGGVPVAYEVARSLDAPLDVLVVRKLGVPHQEELAMGAIGSGGVRVMNDDVVAELSIGPDAIERVIADEERELERREHDYRGERAPLELAGKEVLLIDDGLATGATMRAAIAVARMHGAARVVVAVPVAARSTCRDLAHEADAIVCAQMPPHFSSVGAWYEDFSQTSDREVRALLA
jgi:predicted phosphoribosyltransferase